MKCFAKKIALASVLLLSLSAGAWAVPYVGSTGLAASQTIDFTPAVTPSQSAVTTQYAGVTFTNWFSGPYSSSVSSGPNGSGDTGYLGNHSSFSSFPSAPITSWFTFDSPVTSASFAMTRYSDTLIEALLGGTIVDSFTPSASTQFYGFQGVLFDTVRITSVAGTGDGDFYIDDLGFGTPSSVPEIDASSASLPLVMCVGLMLGLSDRRRKAEVLA